MPNDYTRVQRPQNTKHTVRRITDIYSEILSFFGLLLLTIGIVQLSTMDHLGIFVAIAALYILPLGALIGRIFDHYVFLNS